ncbi:MAG: type VII toxin-antitoxin system HepT family RNase toxin [Actinomycetota bacterium]
MPLALADRDPLSAAKCGLIVAIETCIDVGQHIIASERLRAPENFADVFAALGEAGMLGQEIASTLVAMVGFRNLLVHGYADVDDSGWWTSSRPGSTISTPFRAEVARAVLTEG